MNVGSQWLGHANLQVALRIYMPIVVQRLWHGGRAVAASCRWAGAAGTRSVRL